MKHKRILLVVLLFILTACGSISKGYKIEYEFPPKQATHIYAYTVKIPEDIRHAADERYRYTSDSSYGYLIPIFSPQHKEKPFVGEIYWLTLHNDEGKLIGIEQINVSVDCSIKLDTLR